jgi:hypothetical protein
MTTLLVSTSGITINTFSFTNTFGFGSVATLNDTFHFKIMINDPITNSMKTYESKSQQRLLQASGGTFPFLISWDTLDLENTTPGTGLPYTPAVGHVIGVWITNTSLNTNFPASDNFTYYGDDSELTYQYTVTEAPSGGGGGGAGDPYITTVSGKHYKLPTIDAPIRFYQGNVDGVTLTVNAQLRTIPSSDLLAYNMRSLITLSKSLTSKQIQRYEKDFSKNETLCFFDSFYIRYGDNELQINVWDGKIKVQKYVGKFAAKLIDNGETALKASGIYSKYKGTTLAVSVGPATIYMSTYESPIVRSGIVVDAPHMAAGNGAIVNVLASKDLVLASLDESKTDVAREDAKKTRVVKEIFSDHAGTRIRNIVTFH